MRCTSIMYWMAGGPGELADGDIYAPVAVAVGCWAVSSVAAAAVAVAVPIPVHFGQQMRQRLHKNTRQRPKECRSPFEYFCPTVNFGVSLSIYFPGAGERQRRLW